MPLFNIHSCIKPSFVRSILKKGHDGCVYYTKTAGKVFPLNGIYFFFLNYLCACPKVHKFLDDTLSRESLTKSHFRSPWKIFISFLNLFWTLKAFGQLMLLVLLTLATQRYGIGSLNSLCNGKFFFFSLVLTK